MQMRSHLVAAVVVLLSVFGSAELARAQTTPAAGTDAATPPAAATPAPAAPAATTPAPAATAPAAAASPAPAATTPAAAASPAPAATTPAPAASSTPTTAAPSSVATESKEAKPERKKKRMTRRQEIEHSIATGTVPSRYRSSVPREYQRYIPFEKR